MVFEKDGGFLKMWLAIISDEQLRNLTEKGYVLLSAIIAVPNDL